MFFIIEVLLLSVCVLARSGVIVPGNCVSVARQFLRCVLHQLAPNNVFPQIFMSHLGGLSSSALLKLSEFINYMYDVNKLIGV